MKRRWSNCSRIRGEKLWIGFFGIDYNYGKINENPEWIQQAHDLGLTVNVWTVNAEEDIRKAIEQGVDFITTDAPELAQRLVAEK